jgi:hypothetical protein
MYESKHQPMASKRHFAHRVFRHFLVAVGLMLFSLGLGMAGYVTFEQLTLMDAFLNAAMLLGGMGPVNAPITEVGKLFAGFYALYAGLIFLVMAALIFTPVVHRFLHSLHVEK